MLSETQDVHVSKDITEQLIQTNFGEQLYLGQESILSTQGEEPADHCNFPGDRVNVNQMKLQWKPAEGSRQLQ